jgi:hypothetical protein
MSSVEDILDEIDLEESEASQEKRPPKKKRKVEKQKKKKSKEEVEAIVVEERTDEDEIRRKELKIILLKNPGLTIDDVDEIDARIAKMSNEEIKMSLESLKMKIHLKSPMSDSENLVDLMGLLIARFYKNGNFVHRLSKDTALLAAVDQYVPNLADYISGPLQILVRVAGHITDEQFQQNNFGPNIVSTDEVVGGK